MTLPFLLFSVNRIFSQCSFQLYRILRGRAFWPCPEFFIHLLQYTTFTVYDFYSVRLLQCTTSSQPADKAYAEAA